MSEEAKRKMMIDVQSLCIRAIMLIHSFPFSIAFVPFHSSKEAPIANHTYNNNKNEVTVFSYEGSPPHPSAPCRQQTALPRSGIQHSLAKNQSQRKDYHDPKGFWHCSPSCVITLSTVLTTNCWIKYNNLLFHFRYP